MIHPIVSTSLRRHVPPCQTGHRNNQTKSDTESIRFHEMNDASVRTQMKLDVPACQTERRQDQFSSNASCAKPGPRHMDYMDVRPCKMDENIIRLRLTQQLTIKTG